MLDYKNWVGLSEKEIHYLLNCMKIASLQHEQFDEELSDKLLNSLHTTNTAPRYSIDELMELFLFSKLGGEMFKEINSEENYHKSTSKSYTLRVRGELYDLSINLFKYPPIREMEE